MCLMFYGCSSLTNIDLTKFNTNKIIDMSGMFQGCSSLTYVKLFNFNSNNMTKIGGICGECPSLNKSNILINDKTILNEIELFKKAEFINNNN